MTTLKVNVIRKPTIKVKVLPNFPSSVTATNPILLSQVGGNYSFSFDAVSFKAYVLTSLTLDASQITTGQLPIARGGTGQGTVSAAFDALSPTTTRGDLIFRNATTNARLGAGTLGYQLQSAGAGADPAWSGFLQTGTGAVTRTWTAKASEGLSIVDFGAINDAVSHADGAITTGTRNFTSATGTFTSNDVGKRIVIPGAGAAGAIFETTITGFTSATAVQVAVNAGTTVSGKIYYYGTDNTTFIQAAINQAQTTGDEVFIPPGSWIISATLNITARVGIRGVGYQGDSGLIYLTTVVTKAAGWLGSTFICANFNAITVTTNDSIRIQGLQIVYPSIPVGGTVGIVGNSLAGSTNANTYSVIRDVNIVGADYCISITDWYDFKIDNCNFLNHGNTGIQLAPTHYPNYGDAFITNCTFASGAASHHIAILSGGGLKIVNNKLNYGAGTSQGIVIAPNLNNGSFIEPLVIVGNSIEGQQQGILFTRSSGNTQVSQVVITGNQIWVGTNCIQMLDNAGSWINGVTISGNFLCTNTNAATLLDFGGCQNVSVNGNSFSTAAAGGVAITINTNATNIAQKGNTFPSIITMIQDAPAVTILTSSSGTYTTPANAKYLVVEGVGGGGGGAGSGTTPGAATAGGVTTFGSSFLTGNGGALGSVSAGVTAAGGTATGGDENQVGGIGGGGANSVNNFGGAGGNSRFGGAGPGNLGSTGIAATVNSGSGGGGAGDASNVNSGGGGGAGGYFKKTVLLPAASYAYAIGAAGTGGTLGTGGSAGGAGAAGKIIIIAYY